jgi:hypothetical protein
MPAFPNWAIRTSVLALALLPTVQTLHAQGYPPHARYERRSTGPVDETIEHLRNISQRNSYYSGRELERYDNAMRHLSEFVERMQQGHFDLDKLDRAIDDVKNVASHNPMDWRARDVLNRDLGDLRGFRASYNRNYRYGYRY